MSTELKPCPFCGSSEVGCFGPGPEGDTYEGECWIECSGCGLELTLGLETRDVTRTAWNTRTASRETE